MNERNLVSPINPSSLPSLRPPSFADAAATSGLRSCNQIRLLLSYASTLLRSIPPCPQAFPPLIKACANLGLLSASVLLHQNAIVHGYASDAYIASSLVHMYAKYGDVLSARKVFDGMTTRDVVPWSAIVGCYSSSGDAETAFHMFNQMRRLGIEPNAVTILSLLSGISRSNHLHCLHGFTIRCGLEMDIILANSLMNVYAKLGRVELARKLFDSMPLKDIVSWNSLITGYSQGCSSGFRECMFLFDRMRFEKIEPNHQTYVSMVSSVTNSGDAFVQAGEVVHAQVIVSGFQTDVFVDTALVSMYLKFRSWKVAFLLFDRVSDRDVVAWTAMISGLTQNDGADKALVVFHEMVKSSVMPATTTIACVLAACSQLGLLNVGSSVHGFIIRHYLTLDVHAWNALITMYAKCGGHLSTVQYVFEMMPYRDLVSWNAIISGCAQNRHLAMVFSLFKRLRLSAERPDSITMVSLLHVCASWGALHLGMSVHCSTIKHGLDQFISISTSLIDMYSKGGDLQSANKCFSLMHYKDLVAWCAIIEGYGNHGMGEAAISLYSDFLQTGIMPNHVIFLSVLSACNHAGLISEGLQIFRSMQDDFSIDPRLEHWACIIDLLCKAGRVEAAASFTRTMLPQANADVLGIVLDACRQHGHARLAEEIAQEIIDLKPQTAGSYVQLAHSYAAMNRWDGVGDTLAQMKTLGLKKAPGWSFVEINGTITMFFADQSSHDQYEEVILLLKLLESDTMINKAMLHS
ncbi:LOW QUALITY PROTEIN: pentatricopeptide repeat-containing protein At4g04370-like [Dioscorea cayenensis subsp. rotundata]|uniref:LOW QUALITY PROTEIN: pentatricopeptide repeat-containing protein At4g04370-like n=1 Tax=Dioscorea cayennensis subsp. rotundata TaxID=55577 RepID=A0AB40B2C2_DIOCR|nr:LOW QUALITY PROTEIN: pentatricopeptide repeat-containing protein At4g04370-like [Dioscorea cayenensis subsp. rotundata]